MPFSTHFHQFFTLCTVPADQVRAGDYVVQVRTNALDPAEVPPTTTANVAIGPAVDASIGQADPSIQTGGSNRFSIRATFGPDPAAAGAGAGVRTYAASPLDLAMHTPWNTPTSVPLIRVLPNAAGGALNVSLWDLGDQGVAASVTLEPPPDETGTPLSCTWLLDGIPAPWLDPTDPSGCTLSIPQQSGGPGLFGNSNGALLEGTVTLPADYSCNDKSFDACWFNLKTTYTADPRSNLPLTSDGTTWDATIQLPTTPPTSTP